jgi:predicted AlkP superfamily pyrophosphatase or phosphodiesterase
MKLRVYITTLLLLCAISFAEARPRLVVNIIVSGLSQHDIARYEKNFSKDGFLRLRDGGVEFSECYADYAPTTSEAGLATLATGTVPAMHGIFSSVFFDRTFNKKAMLCKKSSSEQSGGLHKEIGMGYTTQPFTAQTLSEVVLSSSERNRAITIAHEPLSAMILAGRKGECYWVDQNGKWNSADCYMEELPAWVRSYNSDDMNRVFATDTWYGRYVRERYRNTHTTDITIYEQDKARRPRSQRKVSEDWVKKMLSMPAGNLAAFEFAKRAVGSLLPLHVNDECKVLNICLDVPRNVAERYGSDSIEYEDMLYSLDASLAEFLTFLYAQLPLQNDVVVVLTSDSGMSPTKRDNSDMTRFNTRQFEVIMNAFLSARYGQDVWVLGYTDGSLYLNHDVVYRHKISLEEVQNEVANFALQYRGVAAAVSATAMRSAQFSRGALSLVQNGYNPRRSGDVLVVFDAERIELDSKRVSMSGSIYNYDRHVPFIVCGAGVVPKRVSERITTDQIAPTLATLISLERPQCSDAAVFTIEKK